MIPATPFRILIVDDSPETLFAIKEALSEYEIVTARSGEEALRLLLHHQVELILLDILLPGLDGIETASLIRKRKRTESIPIIFMSGIEISDRKVYRGYQAGGIDYILKPLDPYVLKAKISVFAEAFRRTEELRKSREVLLERNALLESIFSSVHFLLATMDADFNIVRVNRAFAEANGRDPEFFIGKNYFTLYPDEKDEALFRKVIESGEPYFTVDKPFRFTVNENGGDRFWDWSLLPKKLPTANISGLVLSLVDVTERRMARQNLERYAEELERRNRDLQDFAFVASHDLSEPLRKIQVFGELVLSKGKNLDQQAADYLRRMRSAAGRMQSLLDALLSYSRVSTHGRTFEPVDLNIIVREVVVDLELTIRSAGVVVEVGNLPTVTGDPAQLRQLFQNLAVNSLKYRSPGSNPLVRIWAELDGSLHKIYVEDNGIGFDEKYVEQIFKPFQRLHGRNEYEGLGMGLAICRKIIERHKGAITATSAPEKGSTFVITLPVGDTEYPEGAGVLSPVRAMAS
ncbi:MAG: response regulator [Desulfobacteraceae bacterium]|nr:MAG: response regulator [Desulfobacteraceae bacterium]